MTSFTIKYLLTALKVKPLKPFCVLRNVLANHLDSVFVYISKYICCICLVSGGLKCGLYIAVGSIQVDIWCYVGPNLAN